ncbi:MAG: antioxidant AhpC [Gammaproteobacteria bacterium]|nr:MAG: antioxidant AhpC [Gammaproteobacteria bacterium]
MNIYFRQLFISLSLLLTLASCSNQAMVPELSFTDIDNKPHAFHDYRGQAVLVVFWATDCPSCIQEMPELIALHNQYSEKNLKIIAVAMDYDSLDHIHAMRAKKKLPYLIVWDKGMKISQAFGNIRVTPTHFLIAPDGEIVMRKIGALNMNYLEGILHNMGLNPA